MELLNYLKLVSYSATDMSLILSCATDIFEAFKSNNKQKKLSKTYAIA